MRHYLFHIENVGGVIAVFFMLGVFSIIAVNLDFLNVVDQTINDFRLSDMYFSRIRDSRSIPADSNVVVVNIGELNRVGIAQQINVLSEYKPKVIAIDALFGSYRKPEIDSTMAAAIKKAGNVILASKVEKWRLDEATGDIVWDSLGKAIPPFSDYADEAIANLITDDTAKFATTRSFSPVERYYDGKEIQSIPALAVRACQYFDSTATQKFLERKNPTEMIYFSGNWEKYTILDVQDVLDTNFVPETVKGKIVFMGYLGSNYMAEGWAEDRFHTPLNPRQIGRSVPDMFGVVVHANIATMILRQNYLNTTPTYIAIFIAILVCFLNTALFRYIYYNEKLGLWYPIITKFVQFFELFVLVFVFIQLLDNFNFVLDMTLTVVTIALTGDVVEFFLVFISYINMKRSEQH